MPIAFAFIFVVIVAIIVGHFAQLSYAGTTW